MIYELSTHKFEIMSSYEEKLCTRGRIQDTYYHQLIVYHYGNG